MSISPHCPEFAAQLRLTSLANTARIGWIVSAVACVVSAQTPLPPTLGTQVYQAAGELTNCVSTCQSTVLNPSTNALLEAGTSIVLGPGFQASAVNTSTSLQAVIGTNTFYRLTTSAGPGGTITPASGYWYPAGSTVWLNGVPNSGYYFQEFTGGLSANFTPQQLTMTGNESVTANFLGANSGSTLGPPGSTTYLQANLSYMEFTNYTTDQTSSYFAPSCPAGTVQSCFQEILRELRSQGVTGVRVFVELCNSPSNAFPDSTGKYTTCVPGYGSPTWNPSGNGFQQQWINNVSTFFQDVANAGIPNVTITMTGSSALPTGQVWPTQPLASASSPAGSCSTGKCCDDVDPNHTGVVAFNPLVPIGSQAVQVQPPGTGYTPGYIIGNWQDPYVRNNGYNCAPINPYFIGWTNLFNVIDAVLAKAKAVSCPNVPTPQYPNCTPLNIYELELQQELKPFFTAYMRYIYDNSSAATAPPQFVETASINNQTVTFANVLAGLRYYMSAHGFDPGRVQYSAYYFDASIPNYDCGDYYGGYARNYGLDFIAAVINGSVVGVPTDATQTNGLQCGGMDTQSMQQSLVYSTRPDIVDAHIYPTAANGQQNLDSDIKTAAQTDYADVAWFLNHEGYQSAIATIGETHGGVGLLNGVLTLYQGPSNVWPPPAQPPPPPPYCFSTGSNSSYPLPPATASDNVWGFNNEQTSNPLSNYTVVFRPWMELQVPAGDCFPYGTAGAGSANNYQIFNFQGQGPYTPTQP